MALDDLSGAETFPLDALMILRRKWTDARGPLLDALKNFASGEDRGPQNAGKVFFGLHLMAEKREAEAWAPLLAVAMEGEALYDMIGDAASETLPAILLSLYSGDLEGLKKLIEAPRADAWGRVAALECFCALAANGEFPMEDGQNFSRRLFRDLAAARKPPGLVWLAGLRRAAGPE